MLVNFLADTTITPYSSFQFTVDPYEKIQHTDPARLLPTLFLTYLPVKNTQKITSHLHYPMAVSYFFHGNKIPGDRHTFLSFFPDPILLFSQCYISSDLSRNPRQKTTIS